MLARGIVAVTRGMFNMREADGEGCSPVGRVGGFWAEFGHCRWRRITRRINKRLSLFRERSEVSSGVAPSVLCAEGFSDVSDARPALC